MSDKKKNILIIGNGAVVSALAKKLAASPQVDKVFVTASNSLDNSLFNPVDIREDDLTGLLKFAIDNDIDLAIPVSSKSLKADVVGFFSENGQRVFGPIADACKIATSNVLGKKFLYKIHAQTSKFGVYDKFQQAETFLKSASFPVTIKTDEYDNIEDRLVCPTMSIAASFLDALYSKNETNVLIEEYAYGTNFTVYFITDGYGALPITSVRNYKFMEDGDAGILTNGTACFAPDYKVSELALSRVENVVRNALTALEKKGTPYVGILGVDCIMTAPDKFYVNEFKPFLQNFDAATVLNLIEDDLIDVFMACVDGIFADEWENIKLNNLSSVSSAVLSTKSASVISGLEHFVDDECLDFSSNIKLADDRFLADKGEVFVITHTSSTLNRAKSRVYQDLELINFVGMKYRKDILP